MRPKRLNALSPVGGPGNGRFVSTDTSTVDSFGRCGNIHHPEQAKKRLNHVKPKFQFGTSRCRTSSCQFQGVTDGVEAPPFGGEAPWNQFISCVFGRDRNHPNSDCKQ